MGLVQTFGLNVRRVRLDKGLTLEALADEVGLAYTYVGQIERGQRNPTLGVVERIAAALGVGALDLLSAPD
jgi:transcriptional regulator with XRE-family HTH domain